MTDVTKLSDEELMAALKNAPLQYAVNSVESGGSDTAVSPKGAKGRMQVMDATNTNPGFGVTPARDNSPGERARVGRDYLNTLVDIHNGNQGIAAAAYNAGPGRVAKALQKTTDAKSFFDNIPAETQKYIGRVLNMIVPSAQAATPVQQAPVAAAPQDLSQMSDADLMAALGQQPVATPAGPTPQEISKQVLLKQLQPGFAERFAQGGLSSLKNAGLGLNQMLWKGLGAIVPGLADTANQNSAAMTQMADQPSNGVPEMLGSAVNNALITRALPTGAVPATMAGRALQGAASGAGLAGLQPVNNPTDYATEKLKQMGVGAAVGGLASPVIETGAKVLSGATNAAADKLRSMGVTPTPGQILGGAWKRTEDKARSLFLLGDAVTVGQRRALSEFNKATYEDTLSPLKDAGIKATVPQDVGREGVLGLKNQISDAYTEALQGTSFKPDQPFFMGLFKAARDAGDKLPVTQQNEIRTFMNDHIVDRLQLGQGSISGEQLKKIDQDLVDRIRTYRNSSSDTVANQEAANVLNQVRDELRAGFSRQFPDRAPLLNAADESYARYTRVRDASKKVTGTQGDFIFTPSQFAQSVRSQDARGGGKAFGTGQAFMQDISDPATQVLSQNYPDSGTAGRHMLMNVLAGTGAFLNPHAALGAGAGTLMYTPQGQRAMASLLMDRPEFVRALGVGLQGSSGILGGGVGAAVAPRVVGQ